MMLPVLYDVRLQASASLRQEVDELRAEETANASKVCCNGAYSALAIGWRRYACVSCLMYAP